MILVTGAGGFVGGAVVSRLATDRTCNGVVVASRRKLESLPQRVEQVQAGDLLPSADMSFALKNVDAVVHCAARVHVMQDDTRYPLQAYREVNVNSTLNLARQAAKAMVRRFIFVSTIKVNGDATKPGQIFRADDVPVPSDPYGLSKLEAERGLREIESITGMEVVVVRPTLVYGPNVRANFLRLLKIVEKGVPLPFGLLENKRSLVAIDNLVDLLRTCIFHPKAAGQTFLVSDGQDLSTPDLIRQLAGLMGQDAGLINIPPRLLHFLGALTGRRQDVGRLLGSLQVDIEHTRAALDWIPPISVEVGLRKTVDWYLSSHGCRE